MRWAYIGKNAGSGLEDILQDYIARHSNMVAGSLTFDSAKAVGVLMNLLDLLACLHTAWQLGPRTTDMNGETLFFYSTETDAKNGAQTLSNRKKYTAALGKYKIPRHLVEIVLYASTARQMDDKVMYPMLGRTISELDSSITAINTDLLEYNKWVSGVTDIEFLNVSVQDFDIDARIVEDPEFFAMMGTGVSWTANGTTWVKNSDPTDNSWAILTDRLDLLLMFDIIRQPYGGYLGGAATDFLAIADIDHTTGNGPFYFGSSTTAFYQSNYVSGLSHWGAGLNYHYGYSANTSALGVWYFGGLKVNKGGMDVTTAFRNRRWVELLENGIPKLARVSSITMNLLGIGQRENDTAGIKSNKTAKERGRTVAPKVADSPTRINTKLIDSKADSSSEEAVADAMKDKSKKSKDAY
jgi:hypothetical protein